MSKNILESLVLIAVAVGFCMILTWPKYQEYESENSLVMGKQTDIETRKDYFKNLQEVSAELKNYGPNLTKIESALPDDPKAATIVSYMESYSMKAGLVLKSVDYTADAQSSTATPAQTQNQNPKSLKQIHLSIALSGPYQSWKNFLSSIEKNSRMVEIDQLNVSSGDKSKIGSAAMPTSQQVGNLDYVVMLSAHSY